MKMDRSIQILTAGLKAAHERMFSDQGLRRPEYPRSLPRMCSIIEDEVYELFSAVQNRRYTLVKENAADVIVTASQIIEYAELLVKAADKPWNTEE
jgi:NTP pyrophosphatase (non-canonical NTP hydrolase)